MNAYLTVANVLAVIALLLIVLIWCGISVNLLVPVTALSVAVLLK